MPRYASTAQQQPAEGRIVSVEIHANAESRFSEDAAVQLQDERGVLDVPNGPREFDPYDDSTWLPTLTADQIAAIWQRSVGAVKKQCQLGRFIPAPFQVKPYRWRRSDVLRHLESGRALAFPSAVRRRA